MPLSKENFLLKLTPTTVRNIVHCMTAVIFSIDVFSLGDFNVIGINRIIALPRWICVSSGTMLLTMAP